MGSFIHFCPGEKLQALKAKLQEAMKLRRTEERQKRQALFKLDNEEMLEEEEEEEEEMTDESEEEEGDHEVCRQHFYRTYGFLILLPPSNEMRLF